MALCTGKLPVTGGIPSQRGSDAELPFKWQEQTVEHTLGLPVIWDVMAIMWPWWRRCYNYDISNNSDDLNRNLVQYIYDT